MWALFLLLLSRCYIWDQITLLLQLYLRRLILESDLKHIQLCVTCWDLVECDFTGTQYIYKEVICQQSYEAAQNMAIQIYIKSVPHELI